jgi:MerR family copper efflux transcriptional regulator
MKNLSTGPGLTIGALAERTGCNVPTIRYYEEIGLIPQAKRRPSGHRIYDHAAQELLSFIRRCRDFGFPIDQVRELISLSSSAERDCAETRDIAQAHLQTVRDKMAELRALERSLARFVKSCNEVCAGGPATQCSIQKDIAAPAAAPKACCG